MSQWAVLFWLATQTMKHEVAGIRIWIVEMSHDWRQMVDKQRGCKMEDKASSGSWINDIWYKGQGAILFLWGIKVYFNKCVFDLQSSTPILGDLAHVMEHLVCFLRAWRRSADQYALSCSSCCWRWCLGVRQRFDQSAEVLCLNFMDAVTISRTIFAAELLLTAGDGSHGSRVRWLRAHRGSKWHVRNARRLQGLWWSTWKEPVLCLWQRGTGVCHRPSCLLHQCAVAFLLTKIYHPLSNVAGVRSMGRFAL